MGKRELLIVAAFAVLGTIAYQFTAPDPKPGERAFSFSGFMSALRREVRGNNASATDRREGTFPLTDSTREVRVAGAMKITVVGEDRADIAYDLSIESSGPDEATALGYAKRSTFKNDDLGDITALRVSYPREATQTSALLLRVPSRLTVRLESGNVRSVNVTDVNSLHIENLAGDITVVNVPGVVSGTSRGDLVLQDVGSTTMTVRNASSKIVRPRGSTKITAVGGECTIDHAAGPVEVEQSNGAEIRIIEPQATVRATGNTGELRVTGPKKDVSIDLRRAEIEVSLDQAVPVSALGTDETLHLVLADGVAVALDALATDDGGIQAEDFGLAAESKDREARLMHTFAKGTTRVVLRTQRGEIVIRKRK